MKHNKTTTQPDRQKEVDNALTDIMRRIDLYTNVKGAPMSKTERQAGIIEILTTEADKLIATLDPTTLESIEAQFRLHWNDLNTKCSLYPAILALLMTLYYIAPADKVQYEKEYMNIIKHLTLDELTKLYTLLNLVLNKYPVYSIYNINQIDERFKTDEPNHNNPTSLYSCRINARLNNIFDLQDTHKYIKDLHTIVKLYIKYYNDLLKLFQNWANTHKGSATISVLEFAKQFISKTAGSQEFTHVTLQKLVHKYGYCDRKVQTILIRFWNDCVGKYDAKNDKFTIDADKFATSQRNTYYHLKSTRATVSADIIKKAQSVSPRNSKLKTPVHDSDAQNINISKTRITKISSLTNKIIALSAKENTIRIKLNQIVHERLAAKQKLTILQLAQEKVTAAPNLINLPQTENHIAPTKYWHIGKKEILQKYQQLKELLQSILDNQR